MSLVALSHTWCHQPGEHLDVAADQGRSRMREKPLLAKTWYHAARKVVSGFFVGDFGEVQMANQRI